MKLLLKFAALLTISTLVGCAATNTPVQYDSSKSRALNIANAGGIRQIGDHKVPRAEYDRLVDNPVYNAAWTASLYSNPAQGVSPGAGLALGVLGLLFRPDADSANNRILAWMPEDMAKSQDDASFLLSELIEKASIKALNTMQIKHPVIDYDSGKKKIYTGAIGLESEQFGCYSYGSFAKKGDHCITYSSIQASGPELTPLFLDQPIDRAYAFKTEGTKYSLLKIVQSSTAKLPELSIFTAISKNLPEWVFLYFAPKKVKQDDDEMIPYPFILNQGKMELFIQPS